MAVPLIDPVMFPSLPSHRATWAPIYLEPMAGSGERIVSAIAVCGPNGSYHIRPTVHGKVLRCMYGDHGAALLGIVDMAQDALREHLALGESLSSWQSPLDSCTLGPLREAAGESLEEVARHAARLAASLSRADLADLETDDASSANPEVERWFQQVRAEVRERSEALDKRFNKEVVVRPGASPTRIGYLGDRLAANFDALIPGQTLSTKRYRSKARLVDLQILRDQVDAIAPRANYELMLWLPERTSPGYSARTMDAAYAALSELEEFGDKHDLRVRPLHSADAAAARIFAAETS